MSQELGCSEHSRKPLQVLNNLSTVFDSIMVLIFLFAALHCGLIDLLFFVVFDPPEKGSNPSLSLRVLQ